MVRVLKWHLKSSNRNTFIGYTIRNTGGAIINGMIKIDTSAYRACSLPKYSILASASANRRVFDKVLFVYAIAFSGNKIRLLVYTNLVYERRKNVANTSINEFL